MVGSAAFSRKRIKYKIKKSSEINDSRAFSVYISDLSPNKLDLNA